MAKYSDIKGFTVQTLSTDTVVSQIAGGAWASGGSMNASRSNAGGAGIQTSALMVGLDNANPNPGNVEEYNGSTWSEQTDLNTGRNARAMGANAEAVLAVGGYDPAVSTGSVNTESWDGSSWTEVGDLNKKREAMGIFGIYTAGLIASGLERGVGRPADVESWNGSSWTEIANVNQGRSSIIGSGVQTSGIISGGSPAPANNLVESWDGTSWTEVAEMNQNRGRAGGGSGTSNTSAIVFGGYANPPTTVIANTEFWDGSSWAEVADLSTARYDIQSAGNGPASLSLAFGGLTPPETAATEEFTAPAVFNQQVEGQLFFNSTTNTFKETIFDVPGATWASGGDLNTARTRFGGAGQAPQSAALVFGAGSSPYGQTEEYNGTSWSEQNDLNSGRYISPGGAGTQTAALTAGGYYPAGSPNATALSESYNGTSWTEGNDLNEGRFDCVTFGSSTSAILVGGGESPGGPGTVTSVEIYDGTSWTETTDIPTATQEMAGWGTQTSGAIVGGSVDSDPTMKNTTVEWDGTSWSSGGNYSRNNKYFQAFGANVSSGLAAGGENPGESPARLSIAAIYDGTSWSEVAELSSARYGTAGGGTALSGLISGGETAPTTVASTEEWTVNLGNKTITSS